MMGGGWITMTVDWEEWAKVIEEAKVLRRP